MVVERSELVASSHERWSRALDRGYLAFPLEQSERGLRWLLCCGDERGPVGGMKRKRLNEQLKRVVVWRAVDTAFQVADCAHTQPRALGQRLLREPGGDAQALEQRAECGWSR